MIRFTLSSGLLLVWFVAFAQIPPGYYDPAQGLHGEELQQALHQIIDDHLVEDYGDLWDDFYETDKSAGGLVWDMYSDVPGGTPPYTYVFFTDQCGNYSGEGDCYNREHSFPKSWFGGEIYPMYTDLFHVYPTDGYVNNKRGNFPYGEVGAASWTSLNGSKLGSCNFPGYSQTVFEPIDAYKGDFARSMLYMSVRYYEEDAGWPGSDMFDGAQPEEWALNLLKKWHEDDPVSPKETDRNNALYDIQQNRNPFIDHPEYVDLIWFYTGISKTRDFYVKVYPNPADDVLRISAAGPVSIVYQITDICGKSIKQGSLSLNIENSLNVADLNAGIYFILIRDKQSGQVNFQKIVKR